MDYLSDKVVAVTGSSGFIGKRLINALTGSVGQLILMVRKVDHKIMHKQIEFDLLTVLADHTNSVLTRNQLLELVWGYDFEAETNVVDVFIGYLRKKLEIDEKLVVFQIDHQLIILDYFF